LLASLAPEDETGITGCWLTTAYAWQIRAAAASGVDGLCGAATCGLALAESERTYRG